MLHKFKKQSRLEMNADFAHLDTRAWKDTPDNLLTIPAHSVKNKKHKTWSS